MRCRGKYGREKKRRGFDFGVEADGRGRIIMGLRDEKGEDGSQDYEI